MATLKAALKATLLVSPIWLLCLLCIAPATAQAGQTAAPQAGNPAASAQAAPTGSSTAATTPSSILKPALDTLQQTLGGLNLEKWKGGTVRGEAAANISSIMRDLQSTLPALLADADQPPVTMSKSLPVSRNVDALYDVLVRVVDGSRVAAPGEQVTQLQQAMVGVEKARHALDDSLQEMASTQEKHVADLQIALKTQPMPVCPVVTAPPAPAPVKKPVKKKRKPATTAKPAGTTTAPATTPAAAKPNP
ncbi:hypothetical protein [Acidicapsa ligni]|uniref:hypothetical protein n=1 Tax=Acidicapsa ligni TaxID=542300 RepID=UPI0021E06FC0|nr:hypothetical protein [Acidicapsa ligni]